MHKTYNSDFYAWQRGASYRSAKRIVPDLLSLHPIASVLDVGCGVGTWLRAFQDEGLRDFAGVDGPWIRDQETAVPLGVIQLLDLSADLDLGRRFDLVTSLEVAEHLDPAHADRFVANLVRHGDLILFSAAAPHQGGNGHLNEQWPEYWAEKFRASGYRCSDSLRLKFWMEPEIEWWYAQNLFLAVREGHPLAKSLDFTPFLLPLVHPGRFAVLARQLQQFQEFFGMGDSDTAALDPCVVLPVAASLLAARVKTCIVCGAGQAGLSVARVVKHLGIQVLAISDQNPAKVGTCPDGIPVISMKEALRLGSGTAVVASLTHSGEIADELSNLSALMGIPCPEVVRLAPEGPGSATLF